MKRNSKDEYLNRDEVNEMIESALRRHNRRSTIIIKSFSKDRKTALDYINQEKISYMQNYYQKFI